MFSSCCFQVMNNMKNYSTILLDNACCCLHVTSQAQSRLMYSLLLTICYSTILSKANSPVHAHSQMSVRFKICKISSRPRKSCTRDLTCYPFLIFCAMRYLGLGFQVMCVQLQLGTLGSLPHSSFNAHRKRSFLNMLDQQSCLKCKA